MSDYKCPRCGDDMKYPWKHFVVRNDKQVECNGDTDAEIDADFASTPHPSAYYENDADD